MVPVQNIFVKFSVINGISYLALSHDLFEINDVGQVIWESIDGYRDVNGISIEVANKYKTTIETVQDDVQVFVEMLLKKGLVEL